MLSALWYCAERSVTSRDLATWTSWSHAHFTMGSELQTSDGDIQASVLDTPTSHGPAPSSIPGLCKESLVFAEMEGSQHLLGQSILLDTMTSVSDLISTASYRRVSLLHLANEGAEA